MSASAAAKQKLDELCKQHDMYREKLRLQEEELRRLQNEICQNRTVVEATMPGEIEKAYGEYLNTLKYCTSQEQENRKEELRLSRREEFGQLDSIFCIRSTSIFVALYISIVCAIKQVWAHVILLIALFFAGFIPGSRGRHCGTYRKRTARFAPIHM